MFSKDLLSTEEVRRKLRFENVKFDNLMTATSDQATFNAFPMWSSGSALSGEELFVAYEEKCEFK